MYFDPISSWLVALLVDGAIILSEKTYGGCRHDFERKEITDMNDRLNNDIRRIRERLDFISPVKQLDEIKRIINYANKSSAVTLWGGNIIIAKDNQEYIIDLLEACVKKYRDDMVRHADNPRLMEEANANAERYQGVLDKVNIYQVMRYDVERTDTNDSPSSGDSGVGCLILMLIGVAAVLCLCGIISIVF